MKRFFSMVSDQLSLIRLILRTGKNMMLASAVKPVEECQTPMPPMPDCTEILLTCHL